MFLLTISWSCPRCVQIVANFGDNLNEVPFKGDLEAIVRQATDKLYARILATAVPRANKSQDLVGELVFEYLTHHGHWDTAAAVAKDVLGGAVTVPEGAREEAAGLQRVSEAILQGNIDAAVETAEKLAPGVMVQHPRVAFALQCQKFCELVRC